MSRHERSIPQDPAENLKQLAGINEHLQSKCDHKKKVLGEKEDRATKYKDLLADMPSNLDECTDEELKLAASREQILMATQIEIDKLNAEIRTLEGQLRWNENKQEQVKEVLRRMKEGDSDKLLTYTMAAALRAASAAQSSVATEESVVEETAEASE